MIPWFKFIYIQRYPSIIAKSMIYVLGYLLRNRIKSVLHHIPTNNDANFQRGNSKFSVFQLPSLFPFYGSSAAREINDPTESVSYILKDRIDSPVFFRRATLLKDFVATTLSPLEFQRINRNWSKGMLEQS